MLFDYTQQLGLEIDFHVADFVEQQGPAVGQLEASRAPGVGSGKRASLMPEQFTLE